MAPLAFSVERELYRQNDGRFWTRAAVSTSRVTECNCSATYDPPEGMTYRAGPNPSPGRSTAINLSRHCVDIVSTLWRSLAAASLCALQRKSP